MNDPRLWIVTLSEPRSSVENPTRPRRRPRQLREMSCNSPLPERQAREAKTTGSRSAPATCPPQKARPARPTRITLVRVGGSSAQKSYGTHLALTRAGGSPVRPPASPGRGKPAWRRSLAATRLHAATDDRCAPVPWISIPTAKRTMRSACGSGRSHAPRVEASFSDHGQTIQVSRETAVGCGTEPQT